eukprot:422229-Rhodomonas_salina.3
MPSPVLLSRTVYRPTLSLCHAQYCRTLCYNHKQSPVVPGARLLPRLWYCHVLSGYHSPTRCPVLRSGTVLWQNHIPDYLEVIELAVSLVLDHADTKVSCDVT